MSVNNKGLFVKSINTLRRDGLKAFFVKAKNYTVFHIAARFKKEEVKDILFVNGCTLPHPERYRVDHQMEQLESNGLTVDKVLYTELDVERMKYYRGIVFFRCPITDEVKKMIERARYFNKTTFFDIDDLVIDRKYTDLIQYVQNMESKEKAVYDDGVERMSKTMLMCDYLITTTEALARELRKYGKEVFVNRNVASEEMARLSLDAISAVKKDSSEVVIGYLSGSITHNPDFELIKPALIKIMDEYDNVKLVVMGHLDLPSEFKRFNKRVICKPFTDWRNLPNIIAGLDINLAPIEKTIFNEAKSENKWMEAALCNVVTVASNFGAFRDVIEDGKTGVLCSSGEEWYRKLKLLIDDKNKRNKIARAAKEKVFKEYITTYSGLEVARFIESKLSPNVAFVLPSTNISGGVNVVLKHCDILRKNGWDVMVINMDKSDENFINDDGEVNVVSGIQHNVLARFDRMVATLYTTLEYVKTYADVKRRLYLVQNFETNFGDYGFQNKKIANSTYNALDGIEYITISKWCERWLKEDFGKSVRYAPNGIDSNKFSFKKREFGKRIRVLIEGNSEDYYKNVDEAFKVVEKLDKKKYEIVYLSYLGKPKEWYYVDCFYNKVPYEKVPEVYKSCDILLKTSILESFSYPPLEMMATGGYVVVVPNEGNSEYLADGVNCLLYEQGNIDEAVEKIERIYSGKKLRRALDVGAKDTVNDRDWGDIEDKILDLYR